MTGKGKQGEKRGRGVGEGKTEVFSDHYPSK
jgi:hypothetical protein